MNDSEGMLREGAPAYVPAEVRLTYDDYRRMPAGERYELGEGALRKMVPAPSVPHQEISKRLARLLLEQVEEKGLGKVYTAPLDVVLSPHDVLQPDLLCVAQGRLDIIREACVQGAPDLVVEILSPNTADWDRLTKRRIYARYGVREMWLVAPASRTVEVATHDGRSLVTSRRCAAPEPVQSTLFSELVVDTEQLFRA